MARNLPPDGRVRVLVAAATAGDRRALGHARKVAASLPEEKRMRPLLAIAMAGDGASLRAADLLVRRLSHGRRPFAPLRFDDTLPWIPWDELVAAQLVHGQTDAAFALVRGRGSDPSVRLVAERLVRDGRTADILQWLASQDSDQDAKRPAFDKVCFEHVLIGMARGGVGQAFDEALQLADTFRDGSTGQLYRSLAETLRDRPELATPRRKAAVEIGVTGVIARGKDIVVVSDGAKGQHRRRLADIFRQVVPRGTDHAQ